MSQTQQNNMSQLILSMTFSSPIVGGHQNAIERGQVFTHRPKKRSITNFCVTFFVMVSSRDPFSKVGKVTSNRSGIILVTLLESPQVCFFHRKKCWYPWDVRIYWVPAFPLWFLECFFSQLCDIIWILFGEDSTHDLGEDEIGWKGSVQLSSLCNLI